MRACCCSSSAATEMTPLAVCETSLLEEGGLREKPRQDQREDKRDQHGQADIPQRKLQLGERGQRGAPGYMSTIPMTMAISIKAAPVMPAINVPGKTNNSNTTKTKPSTKTIDPAGAGKPRHVTAQEIKRERGNPDDARQTESRRLEFDVKPHDADDQQQRADGGDPDAQLLRAGRFDFDALRPGVTELRQQGVHGFHRARARATAWGVAIFLGRLPVGERQDVSFLVEDFAVDASTPWSCQSSLR